MVRETGVSMVREAVVSMVRETVVSMVRKSIIQCLFKRQKKSRRSDVHKKWYKYDKDIRLCVLKCEYRIKELSQYQ